MQNPKKNPFDDYHAADMVADGLKLVSDALICRANELVAEVGKLRLNDGGGL